MFCVLGELGMFDDSLWAMPQYYHSSRGAGCLSIDTSLPNLQFIVLPISAYGDVNAMRGMGNCDLLNSNMHL